MENTVRDLVVAPFAEIAEKGKTAVDNATAADNKVMLKAAQGLVREGDRALKRIEPLCNKHLEEFGSNFVDALKENDEIAQYRTELNDLLWEFDDYIEADDFDGDKFAELQGLSRKAAPRILDILMRMKLEPAPAQLPPTTPMTDSASIITNQRDTQVEMEPDSGIGVAMGAQSGPDLGLEGSPPIPARTGSTRSSVASSVPDEVPPEPTANPWHLGQRPVVETIPEANEADETLKRRQRISARPDSPTVPSPPPTAVEEAASPGRRDIGVDHVVQNEDERGQWMSATSPTSHAASMVWRPSTNGNPQSSTPTAAYAQGWPVPNHLQVNTSQALPIAHTASPNSSRYSQASSANGSGPSSVFEGTGRDSVYDATSPATTANRASLLSAAGQSPVIMLSPTVYTQGHQAVQLPPSIPPIPEQVPPGTATDQPGLEPVQNAVEVDHGLIPVESDQEPQPAPVRPLRKADLRIGPGSSFQTLRGFCEGAKEVQQGKAGVRKVKKLVYGGGSLVAAKCNHCLYELEWRQVENDRAGDPNCNYKSNGIGFRLRFLSKSHLRSKTVEDQVYACLFCIQLGKTTEESDATVYFSQGALFAHLARHPRPLPVVSGLTVIDAPEIPPAFRNDFDLHFIDPPRVNVMDAIRREVQMLPTAIAVDSVKRTMAVLKRPPGGGEPLQFAIGAKIVGVEYPTKWNGEWCIGWSDQTRAAFPADAIRIDPPPKSEIRMDPSSTMQAKVRWKWHPKDNSRGDWLKLDKNDTISNITWAYPGFWCWAGTNSKGKWGVFPQSHIDSNSLREAGSFDAASIKSHERKSSAGGLLSKMSIRRDSGRRPGSSAGSSSTSHDTAYPMSPRPSIY